MRDHLHDLVNRHGGDSNQKWCLAREYLQARILQCLQECGVFTKWAMQGGTALRFLYSLPRFSEDLDFAMAKTGMETGFEASIQRAKFTFEAEGYSLAVKVKAEKTVATAFIRFPGLPFDLGLSPHTEQVLSVRVEIDANPPAGATLDTTIVRRHLLLHLHHYDRATLLAGKLHAILSRPWCKGRDLYDLAWYLADKTWPEPNVLFLNAALQQTGWSGPVVSPVNWREIIAGTLENLDVREALEDVRPFLERPADLEMLERGNLLRLLKG